MTLRDEAVTVDAAPTGRTATEATTETPPRDYYERKESGWCTHGLCERRAEGWPNPEQQLCRWHRQRVNAKRRRRDRALRASLRARGLCVRCETPSATYRCTACAILDGVPLASSKTPTGAPTDKASRIAAATKVDPTGRVRYHGTLKRGNQPQALLNEQEIEMAEAAFARWKMGVRLLATEEVRGLPPVQKQAAKDAVCLLGNRVGDIIDVVADRLGHFKQKHGKRDGE